MNPSFEKQSSRGIRISVTPVRGANCPRTHDLCMKGRVSNPGCSSCAPEWYCALRWFVLHKPITIERLQIILPDLWHTVTHTHTQCGEGRAGPLRSDEDWAESHQRSRRCLRLNNVSSLIKLSHRFRSRAAIDLGRCFRLRSAALPCAEERLRCTLTSIKRNKSLHRTSVQKDPPWARAGSVPLACFSLHFGAIVTTYSWGARVFSPAWTSGRNCDSDSSALGSFYRTWDGAGHLSDAVFSSSFVEPCTEKRKIR